MDFQKDLSTQQQIDDFNARMADMAGEHRKALVLTFVGRLQQDAEEMRKPPKVPRFDFGGLLQRIGQCISRMQTTNGFSPSDSIDDKVIIIDGSCSPVNSGKGAASLFEKKERL